MSVQKLYKSVRPVKAGFTSRLRILRSRVSHTMRYSRISPVSVRFIGWVDLMDGRSSINSVSSMNSIGSVNSQSFRISPVRRLAAAVFCASLLSLFPAAMWSQPASELQGPNPSAVQIKGRVINGTNGAPAAAEKLELIRPGQQMTVLHTLENPGTNFRFPPAERVAVPFLIRATYQGETYVTVIPPVAERQDEAQLVQVFDSGARDEDLNIMPGLEILNEEQGLRINLVYSVENASNPPRTYAGDQFIIRVPETAKVTGCRLAHQSSRMPAPFTCNVQDGAISVPKGFRPGSSQLTVQLEQSSREYRDPEASYPFKVVVWKPEKAKPEMENEKAVEELNIRGLGPALKVDYDGRPVVYNLPDDSFHYANPLQSDYNPVFKNATITIVSVLGVIAILFLAFSLLSSFRIQVKRNR